MIGEDSGYSEDDSEVNMALMVSSDPLYFEEAVKSKHWKLAMDIEIESKEKNKSWSLVDLPAEAKKVRVKWVCKTKYNKKGERRSSKLDW